MEYSWKVMPIIVDQIHLQFSHCSISFHNWSYAKFTAEEMDKIWSLWAKVVTSTTVGKIWSFETVNKIWLRFDCNCLISVVWTLWSFLCSLNLNACKQNQSFLVFLSNVTTKILKSGWNMGNWNCLGKWLIL